MTRSIARVALAVAAAVVMSGCGDDPFEIPTNPSPPTIFTETFSGAVTRNGAATHTFATQASGTVTATLTSLSAAEGTRIGLALGTYNAVTAVCQLVITKDDAVAPTTITGAVSAVGNLCVRIYDVGALTNAADYEIQVSHP
jgi:hypothetical protein